jgi:hypothetical protein
MTGMETGTPVRSAVRELRGVGLRERPGGVAEVERVRQVDR